MDVYERLAEKHNYRYSDRYRRILEFVMTPIQAEVADALPGSFKEVATKVGLSLEEVKEEINELFKKGVVIPKDFSTLEGARFCPDALRLHDATAGSRMVDEIYGERAQEFWDLWEEFCQEEFYPIFAKIGNKMEVPPTRVVPAYEAIKKIEGISPYDDVREIVKAAPRISVVACSCRSQAGKKDVIVETCLQFGRGADYGIARGSGREIDSSDAIAILKKAAEDGLIHRTTNWQSLGWLLMCSCHKDSCLILTPLFQYNVPVEKRVQKSRFQAFVDDATCTGCEVCVDRCQFEAIEMKKSDDRSKLTAVVKSENCWGCGLCTIKCEPKAINLKLVRPLDHIPPEKPKGYRHT